MSLISDLLSLVVNCSMLCGINKSSLHIFHSFFYLPSFWFVHSGSSPLPASFK